MTEQERQDILAFFHSHSPREVARLSEWFHHVMESDVSTLYEWKMARQMSSMAAASGVKYR